MSASGAALPPQEVRPAPKVGQRWRFTAKGEQQLNCRGTRTIDDIDESYVWAEHGALRLSWFAEGLLELVSEAPAPQVAGRGECTCHESGGRRCPVHGGYGTQRPDPPQSAPVVCQWRTNVHACSGAILKRVIKQGSFNARLDLCDAHYLSSEKARTDTKPASKPSQPPRWWSPAIESLGAVRPFGKPRGWR